MTTDDEHAEPFGADVEQIRRRCLGRTIVDIIAEEESGQKWRDGTIKQTTWWIWVGLVLDDGTRIRADGGEDAGGGYGFLEIERGKGAG